MAGAPNKQEAGVVGGPRLGSKRLLVLLVLTLSAIAGLYLLAGSVEGFSHELKRLRNGDPAWLAAGCALELLSLLGYALLFWSVVARDLPHVGFKASLQIPLAGIAALRLLATGGAGGFAVTAWALRQAGLSRRAVGTRMVAVLVVQYAVYLLAVALVGYGLWAGAFAGGGTFALTLLPALCATGAIAAVVAFSLLAAPTGELPAARLRRYVTELHLWVHGGTRAALQALGVGGSGRSRLFAPVGAVAYWGFDLSVLYAGFRAFGGHPTVAVVVMVYFLGTLGSLLPLPGGIGGVEGGMIGVAIGFGLSPARAILAVIVYRLISFWLPTVPGVVGYFGLRRTVQGWREAVRRRGSRLGERAAGWPAGEELGDGGIEPQPDRAGAVDDQGA